MIFYCTNSTYRIFAAVFIHLDKTIDHLIPIDHFLVFIQAKKMTFYCTNHIDHIVVLIHSDNCKLIIFFLSLSKF